MQVVPLIVDHASQAARIHAASLSGDFLPSLGAGFLTVFYRTALQRSLAFGFTALEEGGRVQGFVLGSADTTILFRRVIRSAALPLAWAALPALLRRPGLWPKIFETFLYPRREAAAGEPAELLVIAVEAACRGQGLGEKLVEALNQAFNRQGVTRYKVTVLASNEGANRFYRRLGFRPAGAFRLYQKAWNLYLLSLDGTPS